jgi:hypothetical protein
VRLTGQGTIDRLVKTIDETPIGVFLSPFCVPSEWQVDVGVAMLRRFG